MVFIVKVAYNMEMVKIAKITKIYGGNTKSGLERGLQPLYIYLIKYIFKIFTVKIGLCGGRKNNKTYRHFRFCCDSEKADFNPNICKYFGKFKENLYIKFYYP